jgi:hypothetical protein
VRCFAALLRAPPGDPDQLAQLGEIMLQARAHMCCMRCMCWHLLLLLLLLLGLRWGHKKRQDSLGS